MTKAVVFFHITEHHLDQRIDNFLVAHLKGVPKSHIYKMVSSGGVRVNKKRVKPSYRLQVDDQIRVPPVRTAKETVREAPLEMIRELKGNILHEDDQMIVINKPTGIPVHAGSGMNVGVIEALRQAYDNPHLELAHRIDKETSGCLVIAKTRPFLKEFHDLFRGQEVEKVYLAILEGLLSSDKVVEKGDIDGKESETLFIRKKLLNNATFVEAYPKSGRTHQIRIHALNIGHPILGDVKYGNGPRKRLYLHAYRLKFTLSNQKIFEFEAPVEREFTAKFA